jgi:hypothetical protein
MLNTCKLAPAIIIISVILVNILDVYMAIRYNFRIHNLILGISLIFAIGIAILLAWIANKTCNNYAWVSWVIIALILLSVIDSVILLVDPVKREKVKKEIETADRSIQRIKTVYDPATGIPIKQETKTYQY